MADILTDDLYPSVRAALDINLTVAALPDATLDLAIYAPTAERLVKAGDPDWATREDDAFAHLEMASVYYCASLIALALPNLTKESFGQNDYSYTMQGPSSIQLAKLLRARAATEMALARGDTGMPTFFTVAPGERARTRTTLTLLPAGSTVAG